MHEQTYAPARYRYRSQSTPPADDGRDKDTTRSTSPAAAHGGEYGWSVEREEGGEHVAWIPLDPACPDVERFPHFRHAVNASPAVISRTHACASTRGAPPRRTS